MMCGQYKCPKCGHGKFKTFAIVKEYWIVDARGTWIADAEDNSVVVEYPDDGVVWTCLSCGHDDYGDRFKR